MIARVRRAVIALLGLLLLGIAVGCAGPDDDGIGGTGVRASGDGIGGTGVSAALDPEGIGGTGIVGEITALGSIVVAGISVDVPVSTQIERAGQVLEPSQLAVGHVVAVHAESGAQGLQARKIRMLDALVGPIAAIELDTNTVTLLGQRLTIDPARVRSPSGSGVGALSIGQRVRVSGLWQADGALRVTRIEPADAAEPDAVFAPISAVTGERLSVGALDIAAPSTPAVSVGDWIEARGEGDAAQLKATRIRSADVFDERMARVFVDGYVSVTADRKLRIGPVKTGVDASSDLHGRVLRAVRDRTRVTAGALVRDGTLKLRALQFEPRRVTPRRAVPTLPRRNDLRRDVRPITPRPSASPPSAPTPAPPVKPSVTPSIDTRSLPSTDIRVIQ